MDNPFGVTKSDDFSNEEIQRFWVEPGGVSASTLLKPTRLMSMEIIGGKGSGKTHLLRHFALTVHKAQQGEDPLSVFERQGYLGVYVRCDSLNPARFSGKSQDGETWLAVFQYFIDLWLVQALLDKIAVTIESQPPSSESLDGQFPKEVCALFDEPPELPPTTLNGLRGLIRGFQREIDVAINNLPITRKLEIRIRTGPSRLIFGVPQLLSKFSAKLSKLVVLYLLDEMENLSLDQQKYINTLIRHRTGNCSFRLGARLYGIKTNETIVGEINRPGAEFDVLELDAYWRSKRQYKEFCAKLCISRLQASGYFAEAQEQQVLEKMLTKSFEEPTSDRFYHDYTNTLFAKCPPHERPYLKRLRNELGTEWKRQSKLGIRRESDIDEVLAELKSEPYPLIEKLNIFLLYKDWSKQRDLRKSSARIGAESRQFISSQGTEPSDYFSAYQHFSADMLAQLMHDARVRVKYSGFDTFVRMSSGLPRNLLFILKNVFDWAIFNGEQPFKGKAITMETQERAVIESSSWFFEEARPTQSADQIQRGIDRLATLFREIRYSEKPSECSLCTFSCPVSALTDRTKAMLNLAQDWSMLIKHRRGQKDRNSSRVDDKFQLSPMLAVRWELPLSRRGALALNADEVNAIFGEPDDRRFEEIKQTRTARMSVPFRDAGIEVEPALFPED